MKAGWSVKASPERVVAEFSIWRQPLRSWRLKREICSATENLLRARPAQADLVASEAKLRRVRYDIAGV